MRRNSSNSRSWRTVLRNAVKLRLGGRDDSEVRLDLGQAIDIAMRNAADRRLREAAPDAAISNMLRLIAEPVRLRPQSEPGE